MSALMYRAINLDWENVLSFCSQLLLLTDLKFIGQLTGRLVWLVIMLKYL